MPAKIPSRTIAEQAENEASVRAFAHALKVSGKTEKDFADAMSVGSRYTFNEDQVHRWKGARHSDGRQTLIPALALRRAALAVGLSVDELYAAGNGEPSIEGERFRSLQAQVEEVMPTMRRIQELLSDQSPPGRTKRPPKTRPSELRAWAKAQAQPPQAESEPPGLPSEPAPQAAGLAERPAETLVGQSATEAPAEA